MTQLLEGIRILDWTMFHNGSATGYMLGDLGAEVIHIEKRITGDDQRGMESLFGASMSLPGGRNLGFETACRNKKGITLDMSKDKGREVLYRLAAKSDVMLTNFRRSVAQKLKVDYESLCAYNPKIIFCYASAYGTRGPDGETRGFDPLGQARSGIMFQLGDRDQNEPLQVIGGIVDQLGATMAAYGILGALLGRELHGFGQEIETSLLGSMIHQQVINVNAVLLRGREMARHSRTRARNPLSNMYRCGDDKWIIIAEPQSDRFWHPFCEALEIPHLADDPRFATALARRENCQEIIKLLDEQFASQPREYWMKGLRERGGGIACDVISTLHDLAGDAQVIANDYIVDYEHETLGPVKLAGFPVRFTKTPGRINRCAPEFGEHTEEILMDIGGYSWEEIEQLREEEVI